MSVDDHLWPDGGSYANFADDAGDDYGFRFVDADGSERGPLSSQFIHQIADELDRETNDHRNPRRPNGAILLRRIADDYDRLRSAPLVTEELAELFGLVTGDAIEHWAECPAPPRPGCETCKAWFRARTRLGELLATPAPADAMTRLFEAGFHGVEVDSTDEHVVTPRFTATARDAVGVAVHQAEGDTPHLALVALAELVETHLGDAPINTGDRRGSLTGALPPLNGADDASTGKVREVLEQVADDHRFIERTARIDEAIGDR